MLTQSNCFKSQINPKFHTTMDISSSCLATAVWKNAGTGKRVIVNDVTVLRPQ